MTGTGVPRLAKFLLAAMTVSFLAVLAQDVFGIVTPIWPAAWQKAYNATEFFAAAVCAHRAWHSRGPERAAWTAFALGLFAFFTGDIYYTVALSGLENPPFPSPADIGYLGIYPGAY